MDLDWITLYDQMSIVSQTPIRQKINKFYESFYPLKLKKQNKPKLKIQQFQRGGFLGMLTRYMNRVLVSLSYYLETEYYYNEGKLKDDLKLSMIFVDIEHENLTAALHLQKTVYVIQEAYKYYMGKEKDKINQKSFLEMKIICMLKRLSEFYHSFYELSPKLERQSYIKVENLLRLNTIEIIEQGKKYFKLYPEISEILKTILQFIDSDEKHEFNFNSHLMEESGAVLMKSFSLQIKKLFPVINSIQKQLFLNLSDEKFLDFLNRSGFKFEESIIENYFRSEQEISSIVAEQQNFLESIMVPEIYRGTKEWNLKVVEQMINLSTEGKQKNQINENKQFKLSQDFPLSNQ